MALQIFTFAIHSNIDLESANTKNLRDYEDYSLVF